MERCIAPAPGEISPWAGALAATASTPTHPAHSSKLYLDFVYIADPWQMAKVSEAAPLSPDITKALLAGKVSASDCAVIDSTKNVPLFRDIVSAAVQYFD